MFLVGWRIGTIEECCDAPTILGLQRQIAVVTGQQDFVRGEPGAIRKTVTLAEDSRHS
jgi:hypothetical protein